MQRDSARPLPAASGFPGGSDILADSLGLFEKLRAGTEEFSAQPTAAPFSFLLFTSLRRIMPRFKAEMRSTNNTPSR